MEGQSNNWYSPGSCYYDMIWTYKIDGTFQNESAGCIPGTLNGKWMLLDNNKTIKVEYTAGGFANFQFKIIELTPTSMVVQRVEHTGIAGAQVSDYQEMDLLNQYEFVPK